MLYMSSIRNYLISLVDSGNNSYTKLMKKAIFGIFAHPDDEAFGPCGTLLMEAEAGTQIHLILLTAGEAGRNPDNVADLSELRLAEWRTAGQLLGVSSQKFLAYHDGKLCNDQMEKIGQQIIDIVNQTIDEETTAVELMSTDLNGITGHIDHIVAARAASFAYHRLKSADSRLTKLRLACVPRHVAPEVDTRWLFAEPGRTQQEIDEVVDAREHRDKIISIMKTHHSQRQDCQSHLENNYEDIGMDYFIVQR